ncbi:DUF3099 domain-containing protein [Aeromicrobium sp.]|uniref:DUF3099 domain-containing protein n=1 Tax=Aeromicrobium sp. TaxID=1871063 RepID=UPI0019A55708|nr:DUF3099 domain-containing protein [Aeromicrobium sp.]MBC7629854.1 DUF3099 domain-containing protein [Aeromicrobium sp.]
MSNEPREPRKQKVFSITTAATSQSQDLGHREKRYAISMGIRTVCFVGAVIVSGPLRWVLIAGAVFLPYAAVILANAGVRKKGAGPSPFGPEPKGAIEAPRTVLPHRD